eukprot:15485833-Alexandrium_andersonii.AAC.1
MRLVATSECHRGVFGAPLGRRGVIVVSLGRHWGVIVMSLGHEVSLGRHGGINGVSSGHP